MPPLLLLLPRIRSLLPLPLLPVLLPPRLLPLPLLLSEPPLLRSLDEPMPRSLELEPEPELLRLSDEPRSENIARSLLVPRSPDDDSRLRMLSLLREEPLELTVSREPSACSISDERFGPPC
jgi:hypothetical protein